MLLTGLCGQRLAVRRHPIRRRLLSLLAAGLVAGLATATLEDLRGGDAEHNARAMRALLDGAPGAFRDIVILGAAAALIVAGKAADLKDGAAQAADAIDSGRARDTLAQLIAITNESAPAGAES